MFSAEIINAILSEYRIKRDAEIAEAEAKRNAAIREIPELRPIEDELSATGMKIFAAAMDKTTDLDAAMERIQKTTSELVSKREALLTSHGYPEDYYAPAFECRICDDTGYAGGRLCSCVTTGAAKRLFAKSGIGDALKEQTFDNFDLRLYGKKSDRDQMEKVYSYCRNYANSFKKDAESLLFIGKTGLGKTHLSSAIAQTVIQKGFTVMYESAQSIFDKLEAKRFGRDVETDTDVYTECDLLLIDDIGAEHVTQFTTAAFYNLINMRKINKKPLIISTNLDAKEIKAKYDSRILSRLFGEFHVLQFCGQDIRMLKLKEQ